MKASDWIIKFLVSRGVDKLYGYIGGMVTHLADSVSRNPEVSFIQTYHEQSAAFAAEGFARERKLPGVAIATSGPGATNLLTGVANAYFDSVPMLYLTGQVNTYEYKYEKPIRQQGFQETNIVDIARPVTKYAVLLDDARQICYEFEKAWHIASSGRPGPVLIDIPMDIQRAEIDPDNLPHFLPDAVEPSFISAGEFKTIMAALSQAKRPLLLIGGGVSDAFPPLQQLMAAGLPVAVSLRGKGCVPEDAAGFIGMIGSYGNRCANLAIGRADLLLVVGSRLDVRQTGARYKEFAKGKTIIQVDIDADEMNHHRIQNRQFFLGDAFDFLTQLAGVTGELHISETWCREICQLGEMYSQFREVERFVNNRMPYDVMEVLNQTSGKTDVFVTDVGQNQMWAAQTLKISRDQKFLTSGGMAAMGYAVPVAVGVAMSSPHKQVWAVTGDGGLQMALQSLPLISQYRLPIRVLVMNNASLGMITQFQSLYFNCNFVGTIPEQGYCPPDCAALAAAFKLSYFRADSSESLQLILSNAPTSALIEVVLPGLTVISPKLEFDRLFYDMSPCLPSEELQNIMAGKL